MPSPASPSAPTTPAWRATFPGAPLVPGVVLLDHLSESVLAAHPGHRVAGMPSVKFLRPVLPGEAVEVSCGFLADGRVAFACAVSGAEVARGSLLLDPA